jgi:hypothetical protein
MITYETLSQSAQHYKNETNYCSVIALAILKQWKFGRARKYMHKYCSRRDGFGTYSSDIQQQIKFGGKMGNFQAYNQALSADGKWLRAAPELAKGTLKTLPRRAEKDATYVVYVRGHVLILKNGVIDDWTREHGLGRRVEEVFKVVSGQ